MIAKNDVQRKVLSINGARVPVSGQGVFVTIVTPDKAIITEDNSGPVVSFNTVRTSVATINTSQYVPAAAVMGALFAVQEIQRALGVFIGFPFIYTDLDSGTTVTAQGCVILKGADPTGQREDGDVQWTVAALNSTVVYSPAVPAVAV